MARFRISAAAALKVLGSGAALVLVGMHLPAPLHRASGHAPGATAGATVLDGWMPEWQFAEFHDQRVQASPEQIYRAIQEVTGNEILLLRTLTWIRNPRLGRAREESILNAPGDKPILEVAQNGGFVLLEANAPHEVVLGTVVVSDGIPTSKDAAGIRARLARPGNAVATINFRVVAEGGSWCRVTTETRVYATDAAARRGFARYWRVIYPGSSLLRYPWLRAIARRAEKTSAP